MKRRLNLNSKQALAEWDEFYGGLINAAMVDDAETHAERMKRVARLESRPEEWFAYYLAHYIKCEPADFHKRATRRLIEHDRWYEVRAWARELAKSTRSMFEMLYLALTGKIYNALLISNSQDNAERLLRPVMQELETNLRITNDYGQQPKLGSIEDEGINSNAAVIFGSNAKREPHY